MGYEVDKEEVRLHVDMLLSKPIDKSEKRFSIIEEILARTIKDMMLLVTTRRRSTIQAQKMYSEGF